MAILLIVTGLIMLIGTLRQESDIRNPSKFTHVIMKVVQVDERRTARNFGGWVRYVTEPRYTVIYQLEGKTVRSTLTGNDYSLSDDPDGDGYIIDAYIHRYDHSIIRQKVDFTTYVFFAIWIGIAVLDIIGYVVSMNQPVQ